MSIESLILRWTLVAACALAVGAAQAAAPLRADEEASWHLSATAGGARGPGEVPLSIVLGSGSNTVQVTGRADITNGPAFTVSLARQFKGPDAKEADDRRPWRLELEGLQASIRRDRVSAGVAAASIGDDLKVQGVFANALVRVARGENSGWWLGAGVGRVSVDAPDASSALPGCGCLRAGQVDGTVLRVKGRGERLISEGSALVLELGYTRLPELSTGGAPGATTRYGSMGLWNLGVGIRIRF